VRNKVNLSLSTKILASFIFAVVLVFAIMSVFIVKTVKANTYNSEKEKAGIILDSISSEIGMSLFLGLTGEAAGKVKELLKNPNVLSVRISLSDGTVIGRFDSDGKESFDGAIVVKKDISDSVNGQKQASIELLYSNKNYLELIDNFQSATLKFLLIAVVIFALNLLFIKYLLYPLSVIASKMREYSPGKKVEFDIVENDNEIGSIISSFKAMQENIDIYSEKVMQKERELFNQSKLKSMADMINAVAHHWRQPLAGIGALLEDLKFAYRYGELDEAYLEKSVLESRVLLSSMSKTIDNFRYFFMATDENEKFGIEGVVKEVCAAFEMQYAASGIELEYGGDDFLLSGQKELLKEVLVNLLSNSKDAIEDKKTKEPTLRGRIRIWLSAAEKSVICLDNGGGISDENLDRVLEPYFTTKGQGKGVGMGLFMSKCIIENMGGTLKISNTVDGLSAKIKF